MKKILYILTFVILTSSCSDFLKEYSQDLSTVKSTVDLDELLIGSAYLGVGRFTTPSTYQRVNQNYILLHFMSDELDENSGEYYDPDVMGVRDEMFGYFAWQKHISLNTKGISINRENEYWDLSYNKIAACNMIIKETENLNVSKDRDVLDLRRIKGEAHFLRAAYYYMLVNLYGKPYVKSTAAQELGVPVKITEYIEDIDFTRNSVEEVYQQINSDLDMAEEFLSHMETPKSFFRASLNTVYLFRSRIYLFMQNWSEAKRYAELSLSLNRKLLDLRTLSNKDYPIDTSSPETIFSMGGSIFGNFIFGDIDGYDGPAFMVSDYLYNLFEDDDLRKTVYVTKEDDINTYKPTVRKIDNSRSNFRKQKTGSDCFFFRTSEAYLNLAESAAYLGEESIARDQINQLRSYRIESDYEINLSGAELIDFIREERLRELCYEGHRWFDLRRYSVCEKQPYSKVIEHGITRYPSYSRPTSTSYYRLEMNDEAYTLSLPKEVLSFQPSLGSNNRPEREAVRIINY